ncbi:MAG: cadherin-like beta sandwich domain-containing protein [Lachnospiraceae bacterium]|nr:cadherin-like beta sandwich domain-containing protein [Lachnospiraceae bacterium]
MKRTFSIISRKIEVMLLTLICVAAVLLVPMQVQAGPADNSLKSLTVEEGTLSPAFEGSRLNYTVSVPAGTSSVTVNAVTANSNAKILSGAGVTALNAEGDTTIRVLVEAENGNQATYTLTIKRSDTAPGNDTPAQEPGDTSPGDNDTPDTPDDQAGSMLPAGYSVSEDFADEDIPAGFLAAEVEYDGSTVRGVVFEKGDLSLLYLKDESGMGGFYVKDVLAVYPLIRVGTESSYIMLMHMPLYYSYMPGEAVQIPVGDQIFDEAYATESADVYQVYAMDQDGNTGWYFYNTAVGSYESYEQHLGEAGNEEENDDNSAYLQKSYDELNERYNARKDRDMKIIAVLVVIIVILIFIIINMLVHGKRRYDVVDEDDVFEEEPAGRRPAARKKDIFDEEDDDPTVPNEINYEEDQDKETLSVKGGASGRESIRENETEEEPAAADVIRERPWSDEDAFADFDDEPDLFGESRRAKKEQKKKEKQEKRKEKKRRNGDVFDDDDMEEDIFRDHGASEKNKADSEEHDEDELEWMDLNDL